MLNLKQGILILVSCGTEELKITDVIVESACVVISKLVLFMDRYIVVCVCGFKCVCVCCACCGANFSLYFFIIFSPIHFPWDRIRWSVFGKVSFYRKLC